MAVDESLSGGKWLTLGEAAEVLNVHEDAIRAWCDMGILESYCFNGRRGVFVNEDSVKALVRPRDEPAGLSKRD